MSSPRIEDLLRAENLPGVDTEIAPDDEMFVGDHDQYHESGRSMLRNIALALVGAGRPRAERILDLPCGHGRSMRYLRAAFPEAEIVGCDLNRSGVDWCSEHFGAKPVYSEIEPDRIPIEGAFDLIWCGSLLTHLDAPRWADFLSLFERLLAPGGSLVVTLHGRLSLQWLQDDHTYGLDEDGVRRVLEGVRREGFGYADYPGQPGYGISVSLPDWVMRELVRRGTLLIAGYHEMGWHEHQDVLVCRKLPGS